VWMLDEWFSTMALPRKNRAPHGPAYPRSREDRGTNTSGIPSWSLPPTRGSRFRLAPVPITTCRLRRVAPPPVSCRAVLLPSRRPGDSGVPRSPSGSPPRVAATRAARCRAVPGDRVSSPRGADHAVSGSPDPAIELAFDVFPTADSRQPARGSRTGGVSGSLAFASTVMALGSPWPSRSLHRVDSSSFSGSRVPRPRVLLSCSTIPTRVGLAYIVIVPTGLLVRTVWIAPSGLPQVHLTRRAARSPATLALLACRTMSRSSFQRSPLHCLGSRGVHVP
jgi:hypothetical protein